jgi:hypothetical protein
LISLLLIAIICRGQTDGKLLEEAYKRRSKKQLNSFFENWHNQISATSENEVAKLDNIKCQAYRVFTVFYKPLNIDSLGGSEFGNDVYKYSSFLIVQNSVYIYSTDKIFYSKNDTDGAIVNYINKSIFDDTLKIMMLKRQNGKLDRTIYENFKREAIKNENGTLVDSIMNFKPKINGSKPALYLTKKYDTVLKSFLGNKYLPLGSGGIMNPATSIGESKKRQKFLEYYIKIWNGHWGGYWQLRSYPSVYSIVFDEEIKYAKVNFRMIYEGGEAILQNINGQWQLISSKITWIE